MAETWIVSDTHIGHKRILEFTNPDGSLVRPGFRDLDHHDQQVLDNWNSVIKPEDKVYHLGDVAFDRKKGESFLQKANGKKRLIVGNHDIYGMDFYQKYFERIDSWRVFEWGGISFVLCHYPLHVCSFEHKNNGKAFNVHGHIHEKFVLLPDGTHDKRYINVCVEKTNMTPINVDDLVKIAKERENGR